MKAITITQPLASLVALDAKRILSLEWDTDYLGPIAIHSSKSMPSEALQLSADDPFRSVLHAARHLHVGHLPLGYVLATAELWDVRPIIGSRDSIPEDHGARYERYFGDFSDGRYAWLLRDIRILSRPIAAKGSLGVWDWDDSTRRTA